MKNKDSLLSMYESEVESTLVDLILLILLRLTKRYLIACLKNILISPKLVRLLTRHIHWLLDCGYYGIDQNKMSGIQVFYSDKHLVPSAHGGITIIYLTILNLCTPNSVSLALLAHQFALFFLP